MKKYDLILIGSGAGNIVLDAALAKGLSCAIIEKDKFGGTCLNRGCIPTKILLTPSDILRQVDDLKKLGIFSGEISVNWEKLAQRMWEKININKEIKQEYQDDSLTDVYHGKAEFVEDKILRVLDKDGNYSELITADKIIVAVGARTFIPEIKGLSMVDYLTSESFFTTKFPSKPYKSLAILGSGAIGTEFASLFASLGTEVHLIVRGNSIISKNDSSLRLALHNKLAEMGVKIHLRTNIDSVQEENGNVVINLDSNSAKSTLICEKLLIASGVQSNADLLGIERTSIALDNKNYIKTNEFLETSVPGIYALGDVVGHQQLRHKANYEAEILAHNLFEAGFLHEYRRVNYESVPAAIFTHPQVAFIGRTEDELKNSGIEYEVGVFYFKDTAKGYALGIDSNDKNQFVKVLSDLKTKRILGVHAIGPESAIIIQPYINLMNVGEITHSIYNKEISSEETILIREKYPSQYLDPKTTNAISENMVIHPALSEAAIWAVGTAEE